MSNWTMAWGAHAPRTFEELGFRDLRIVYQNLLADEASWLAGEEVDTAPEIPFDTIVSIYRSDVRVFAGRIARSPSSGRGSAERRSYLARGPWADLERTVFQQNWRWIKAGSLEVEAPTEGDYETAPTPRVILGQGFDGQPRDVGDDISEIIAYAADAGRYLTVGSIDVPVRVPQADLANLTCAEAIRTLFRWVPDAVVSFDYNTATPTVHVSRLAAATEARVAIGECLELDLATRDDLRVPAVVLKYPAEHRTNGAGWRTQHVDKWPIDATGTELGALVASIPLSGSEYSGQSTRIVQQIRTRPIPTDPEAGEDAFDFWARLFPFLKSDQITEVTFREFAREAVDETEEATFPLARYIESGSVTPWMREKYPGAYQRQLLRVRVDYRVQAITEPGDDAYSLVTGQDLAIEITATSRPSERRIHREVSDSYTPAEPVPTGLAHALYEAFDVLVWDGQLVIADRLELRPGIRLYVDGGDPAWASSGIPVQRVVLEAERDDVVVTVGPPGHLGPQDLVERLRAFRGPRGSSSSVRIGRRDTGKVADPEDEAELGEDAPTIPSGGGGEPPRSRLVVALDGKLIELDASVLEEEAEGYKISIETVDSSNGDGPGYRRILAGPHVPDASP